MKNKKAIFTTKWIAYTAMLTALVVATSVIPPVPIGANNVYWCDGMILLGAYLMDPVSSFIFGGLGSALYDFCIGHVHMAAASLIIHGLQAAATSALLHYAFKRFKKEPVWAVVSALVGALIVIGGYFLTYWAIFPLTTGESKYGWAYASERVLRNVIQEILGISIATVICYATTFKKQLEKNHLLPDFKKEIWDERKKATEPNENYGETVETEE
ncbi:MAG: ECF transporter S component [Clostridia bacterium]|nr:ECF transporter S component [Clostridia bacterium]